MGSGVCCSCCNVMACSKILILMSLLALSGAVPKPPKKYDPSIHGEKSKYKQALAEKLARTEQEQEDTYSTYINDPVDYLTLEDHISSYLGFDDLPTEELKVPKVAESSYTSYQPSPHPEVLEALRKMVRTQAAASSYTKYDSNGKAEKISAPSKPAESSYIKYVTSEDSDALEIPRKA